MRKYLFILFGTFMAFLFIEACSNAPVQKEKPADTTLQDSLASCNQETIKDPNNPKPMALMMRLMASRADSMRAQIIRGEKLDSNKYAFVKFYLVEPTDPEVLKPQFYENARLFQIAYKALFEHPNEQKKYYNLLINSCIHCHESYCTGPLKRIRKLVIS